MTFPNFSGESAVFATYLGNHLWQSTLFLLTAWALTLPLRHHQARARYWLWLVASLKFLVPFSLLVDLGVSLGTRLRLFNSALQTSAAAQSGFSLAGNYMSRPFASKASSVAAPTNLPVAPAHPDLLPLLGSAIAVAWLSGFVTVVAVWCVRWRRIAAVIQQAEPMQEGRELAILRKLESAGGVHQPIEAVISSAALEPGIFGVFRPVLIWPEGISAYLDDEHIRAILAHELCHVRRRDNLAAAAHMLVEAIFWFHPLVWWMGKRMVEERERACDEQAVELGNEPMVYAESILKTCEFSVGSPLACVSGITGADLKERIVRIMANRGTRMLDWRRKLLLGIAAALAVAVPLAFGLTHARQSVATTPDANAAILPNAKFEVASIRPAEPPGTFFQFLNQSGRLYTNYASLKDLVETAYDMRYLQVEGGPKWVESEHFAIQAKADLALIAELKKLPPNEAKQVQRHMLQELLAERFHLKVERTTKQMPVYVLMVTKHGSMMKQSREPDTILGQEAAGPREWCGTLKDGASSCRISQMDTDYLADWLTLQIHRIVLNKTGLKGNYDFTLIWAPDFGDAPMTAGPAPAPAMSEPSIFTALQEQLGLKLKSEKAPVQALDIVSATHPTPN